MRLCAFFYAVSMLVFSSCNSQEETPELRWLGDISFDKNLDDPNFKVCRGEENIRQYFNQGWNIEIKGDKPALVEIFNEKYDTSIVPRESGLIRIRFIVNCHGQTNRFRMIESDLDYRPITLDRNITDQLLEITKSLSGWKQKFANGEPVDYYQYLIFRIVDGQIIKILP